MYQIHNQLPKEDGNSQYILQRSTQQNAQKKKGSAVIYAGNMNRPDQKAGNVKLQAQKKALKAIINEYKNDSKTDDNIDLCKENQIKLKALSDEAAGMVQKLRVRRQDYMQEYSITDDSEEEKNLKLLEKSIYSNETLTDEELAKLKEMGPLTDYQKDVLEIDAMEQIWKQRADAANNGITNAEKAISGIMLERVKTHPMVDAQIEAVKIIEAASKQAVNMLVNDAKEKNNEKLQEDIDQAQKQQEENKEKKEKLEKAKEEDKIQEKELEEKAGLAPEKSVTSEAVQADSGVSEVSEAGTDILQQELQMNMMNITKQQKILPEELKGIVVDELI